MITDKGKFKAINSNHQIQCPNLKFKGTTNYANCTNHLAKEFVTFVPFVVVRSSNHQVQSSNLNVQRIRCSKDIVYTFGGVLRSCSVRKPQR